MEKASKTNKSKTLTIIGLALMCILVMTKIVPNSSFAGYSILVGVAFFFITEAVGKTPPNESGLLFKTFFKDLKKPGVLPLVLLPIVSALATLFVGELIFSGAFNAHVMGRTSAMLSFDKIPLLVVQVIIAAFGEEIAWRGFFVGKAMKTFPFWLCAVASSVLFSCAHFAAGELTLVIYDIATIFIDSMIYALIYKKTGNCLISTLSHILCNAAGIAASLIFL